MFTQNQKGIYAAIPYFATLYYTISGRKSIRKPKKFPSSFMPVKKRQNPGENGKYLFTKNFKCVNMYAVKIGNCGKTFPKSLVYSYKPEDSLPFFTIWF